MPKKKKKQGVSIKFNDVTCPYDYMNERKITAPQRAQPIFRKAAKMYKPVLRTSSVDQKVLRETADYLEEQAESNERISGRTKKELRKCAEELRRLDNDITVQRRGPVVYQPTDYGDDSPEYYVSASEGIRERASHEMWTRRAMAD